MTKGLVFVRKVIVNGGLLVGDAILTRCREAPNYRAGVCDQALNDTLGGEIRFARTITPKQEDKAMGLELLIHQFPLRKLGPEVVWILSLSSDCGFPSFPKVDETLGTQGDLFLV
jgi:hypothetical protein